MRIAFVNATHRWGGVKTWTLGLARELANRGHAVHLFLRRGDPFADACRKQGLEVSEMTFGPDWNPLAVRNLRRELARRETQVVITNVSKDNRIGGPAARGLGIPVLQHVGGPGDITDRFRVRWEQRRYVTRVLVPAESVREKLMDFPWMRTDSRVTVINNSVDTERFRPGPGAGLLRGELGVDETVLLVVTTGQLTDIKGHDHLLEAFAALSPRNPPPRLVLIGRGPEEERLQAIAARLAVRDRIHFMGFRRDLDLLLEDADIVVQPSLMEGFPISVVEFMAKGKAIVASSLAGVEEAVEDGKHGLLVPPTDVGALIRAMDRLLDDPGLRESMGSAARDRAEAEFGLPRMVDRVESVLQELSG